MQNQSINLILFCTVLSWSFLANSADYPNQRREYEGTPPNGSREERTRGAPLVEESDFDRQQRELFEHFEKEKAKKQEAVLASKTRGT